MNLAHLKKIVVTKICNTYQYCVVGVWSDTRNNVFVDLIKTLNLSISSFLDKNLQQRASSLTYSTILAIVPALAMLFAIARGFGFQNILQMELFKYFPAQKDALTQAFGFVDSYLAQSSEGIFVGIGLVVLLWTLISLMMNVEDAFNKVWRVRKGRSLYRKITDYTAIFLILPVLIICESGLTIFMASITNSDDLFSPILSKVLDLLPIVLTWLIFAGAFALVPNTKVKFKNALIAGFISGSAFQILQWLFVSGQMYVSKYNAIYGSFAFLPLLLVWIQLTWLITMAGVVLTYSSQSIFTFNFQKQIQNISINYYKKVSVIVLSIIIKRYAEGDRALSAFELSKNFDLPIGLVTKVIDNLLDIGLIVSIDERQDDVHTYQPSLDINKITLGEFDHRFMNTGESDFLKEFDTNYSNLISTLDSKFSKIEMSESDCLIRDINI